MDRRVLGLGCAAALLLGVPSAQAQGTVKIGLINVLSGQFADAGIQLDNGVKTYMKQYGDTVAGKKIEIIRRDVGGPAPDVAKRLAQELVVRDRRRHPGRISADAECARRRRRFRSGQEVHGGDERRHFDHHHQVAVHDPHVGHVAAGDGDIRHMGGQGRDQEVLHDGDRLWSRT